MHTVIARGCPHLREDSNPSPVTDHLSVLEHVTVHFEHEGVSTVGLNPVGSGPITVQGPGTQQQSACLVHTRLPSLSLSLAQQRKRNISRGPFGNLTTLEKFFLLLLLHLHLYKEAAQATGGCLEVRGHHPWEMILLYPVSPGDRT